MQLLSKTLNNMKMTKKLQKIKLQRYKVKSKGYKILRIGFS